MEDDGVRLVVISDTHNCHTQLVVPEGDLLVHCGDFTKSRTNKREYSDFMDWYTSLPHPTKVLIAGNRDNFMDTQASQAQGETSGGTRRTRDIVTHNQDIIYLQDSGFVYQKGSVRLNVWGSPWTKLYGKSGKAFQVLDSAMEDKWSRIPPETDLLITHGPPHQVCDKNLQGEAVGCLYLREAVEKRVRPRVHLFGHIHEGYGVEEEEGILFVNAASMDKITKRLTNPPVVIDLSADLSRVDVVAGGSQKPPSIFRTLATKVHPHNLNKFL